MNLLQDLLEKYVENHTTQEPEILKKLNRETHAKVLMPQMLSGHVQGRFLSMMSKMIQPLRVLEIGTFTAYSTLCLSEGLKEGGMIHTIDINAELAETVKKYVKDAGAEKKIKTYTGNALHIIPAINEIFDLVFIDADKNNYCNYYNMVFDKVRKGGYILADNVLWSGKVVEPVKTADEETRGIIEYSNMIIKDKRAESVLIPIRDGVMVSRKIV
jgi:caffeoyl-CoA O-methyltransferase